MASPWNDQVLERLKVLVAEALSAKEIAAVLSKEFKQYFSRNSIIGKTMRSELRLDRSTAKYQRVQRRGPDKKKREIRLARVTAKSIIVAAEKPPEQPPEFAVPLVDLESWHCRWPYGEGKDILFCGNSRIEPHPYCAGHAKMAYHADTRTVP